MTVLAGFDDLKNRDIVVWNANGTIFVDMGKRIEVFQLQLSPTGCITARPIERDKPADQAQPRRMSTREQRMAMTDQGAAMLAAQARRDDLEVH
jgi:hypothetical protein